jgi:hypothetical protein
MPGGTYVGRQYVLVMPNGDIAIDWGSRSYQNVHTGEFFNLDNELTVHQARDADLEILKHSGHVDTYDKLSVWFFGLVDRPISSID